VNKPKNEFPLKIVLSYLVIGSLAVVVSYFLYAEYIAYINDSRDSETDKIVETGTLINEIYETDSFSRIALLTKKQIDFDTYLQKSDSLYQKIDELKNLIPSNAQKQQLDSVKVLLKQKSANIKQLRILKLTREQDTSLDDILWQFKKIDKKTGRLNLDDIVKRPHQLSASEQRAWQKWADYFTLKSGIDTSKVKSITIDSLIAISRHIVLEAKKENSRTREVLKEKENELLQNELNISIQLRKIITDFVSEINKNNILETQQRFASEKRGKTILRNAGIAGVLMIFLFSYIIITDFFKAEKFKKSLQQEKRYSEDLLKSREQLMATVSHDLKTPLNTIVGYSELFTHTQLTEKQKNYALQIASSAHYINKMADDLLDFSKLEAGKLLIEKMPFSLENLLYQIARAFEDLHIDESVDLHLHIDDSLNGKLFESDPLRIQQIVNNLMSNAYKFTESGRIQIAANLLNRKEEVYTVEIAVTDTGLGISKEKQQLIFKEFAQAEKDTFRKFGGSGLGLAISKKIAHLLGGTLEVKSTLGEGSTFFFTVPLVASSEIKPADAPVVISQVKSNLKAVIFDDDPSMLKLLEELFEQMNIHVDGYTQFEEYKNSGDSHFDFILTDIEMPDYSGFQILESFQKGEIEGFKNQPIIAMTGTKKYRRIEYIRKGFTDMLQKPFSKNQVIAVLNPVFLKKIKINLTETDVFKNPANEIYDLYLMNSFLSSQESLNEVLDIFYQQTEQDLSQIKLAIQKFDYDSLSNTTHRMLTMCSQLKAKRVIPILETMEQCAKEKTHRTEMASLFVSLKVEINTLLDALENRGELTI